MDAWKVEVSADGRERKLTVIEKPGGGTLSFREVLTLWSESPSFRTFFNRCLADAPFEAFRWETPPVTKQTLERSFASVLIDSPDLIASPDPDTFADHFDQTASPGIVEFPNLGGDAILVVPAPGEPLSAYAHIGAFVRRAPAGQRDALWKAVGDAMVRRLGEKPVWLNTAGTGVAWLHVRLDDRPKYYLHRPWREDGRLEP